MTNKIQVLMLSEFKEKSIFHAAQQHAYEYLDNALHRNVFPTTEALKDLKIFEEDMPETSGNSKDIINLLHEKGSPGTISQIGGRYFGFVNGGVVPAGLAAKNLSIFWDQNTAMQILSPISSKLETVVERWLINLLGLPENTVAGFVSGTSSATFCGLAAARFRILNRQGWDVGKKGLFGAPKIRIVTCTQAHSSVLKAISMVGLGTDNIEWVDVDDQGRILPNSIPELDENTILILQAGNVNSGAFDDFEKIITKAKASNSWVHIDGAFGLWAGATKQLKHLTKGYENASSWAVDGHKTLNTPYDCGIILCADKEALVSSLHMAGSYLILDEERDGMFYTPEMSRRARIIELWATLKFLGKNGIDEMVTGLHERAVQFSKELEKISGFEVLNEVVFNQVMVQCDTDDLTLETMKNIQNDRVCWVGGSSWKGRKVIRISICSWATTKEDVELSVQSFKKSLEMALK